MYLKDYLSKEQISMLEEIGIGIFEKDCSCEDLYILEHDINEYINENYLKNENFFEVEEQLDDILNIIMDLENECDEIDPMNDDIIENDHIELNNGKLGIVIDITNNAYTIEIDEEYRTGNIDDDIVIVAQNSIVRKV